MNALALTIGRVSPADRSDWLKMRQELWPGSKHDHAHDIDRFFAGEAREPLAVLLARDEHGRAVGFAELSIRPYAEGCQSTVPSGSSTKG
jgi:hypothetical protein